MSVYPQRVLEIASGIREMKIRGAGKIARAAAEALKIAALNYNGVEDLVSFKKYMVDVGELLILTRPTAISLPNAVVYVLSLLRGSSSFSEAREIVVRQADKFIRESEEATKRISVIGAKRIRENSVVLTHCHSTAAVGVIIAVSYTHLTLPTKRIV